MTWIGAFLIVSAVLGLTHAILVLRETYRVERRARGAGQIKPPADVAPRHGAGQAPDTKPPARVYQEHVKILRELRAPEKVVQLAEKACADHERYARDGTMHTRSDDEWRAIGRTDEWP